MPLNENEAVELQKELSQYVIEENVVDFDKIRNICGADVSYDRHKAYSSAVILDKSKLRITSVSCETCKIDQVYIPGLFFLREERPILNVLKTLDQDFDVLMVEGHGRLHPRKCGLASHIGLKIDKPTIGVAKRLLCGRRKNGHVFLDGEIVGQAIGPDNRPVYVSVGHKITLDTAVRIALSVSRYRIPEPVRVAHLYTSKMKNNAQA